MTPSNSPIVVKIGGRVAEDAILIGALASDFRVLTENGHRILLVHGGGTTISALQQQYQVEPRFVEGLRQTDPGEMPLVDMALCGAVNKDLVRRLEAAGLPAWGLSGSDGGLLKGESRDGRPDENRTGIIRSIDTSALELLWNAGYFPICAPPASDSEGRGLNINADEAALALAQSLNAASLVFISDVPGVLENGVPIPALNPEELEEKIASGVIAGGMIPKTRSAVSALADGVESVIIGDYVKSGDLEDLLSGHRGTRIAAGGYQNG